MRKQVVLGIFAASLVVTGLLGSSQTANAAVSPDGSLVKAPGGTVYLIENGQRRPFRVPEVFYSHGFNFNQVIQATAEDLALPLGSLMVYRDGTLIKAPFDPLVYLVTNGQKRGFQSAAAFLGLGYSFNNVVTVDPTTFDDLPTGAAITSTGLPHDPGAIVIFSDGTVYLITETGRKGFATAEDFLSHGYAFDQLVAANQADASLPFEGVMSRRTTIPGATLPDFAVGEMSVSPRLANASFAIEINKEAVVKFAIKNQGAGTQKPDFGLSYPSGLQPVKVDGSIPENTCKDITRLEANQSCTYAVKVTFNQLSESFTGDRMRLDIDHLNSIAESDESNNWGIINFAVRSAASRPKITSLEPNSGPSGTRVVITGTDLILTGQIVSVKFGTTQAEVPFGTSNSTHTVVPNLSPGTYAVTVQVGPYTTNALNFTVTATAPVSAPTASLNVRTPTSYGLKTVDQPAGYQITYEWSSTNATSGSSQLQIKNSAGTNVSSDPCGNTSGPWTISGRSGSLPGTLASCQVGYTYVITYTVTGSGGSASDSITIKVTATTASHTPSVPTMTTGPSNNRVLVNTLQTFYFVSTDPDGDALIYKINWGDGSAEYALGGNFPSGVPVMGQHTWTTAGTYTITVTASDSYTNNSVNTFVITAVVDQTTISLPDFTISFPDDVIGPKLPNAANAIEVNKEVIIKFVVKNQGGGATKPVVNIPNPTNGPSSVITNLSFNPNISQNTCNALARLESNQSCIYAMSAVFKSLSDPVTSVQWRFDLDPMNLTAESDESNNWGIISFNVRSASSVPTLISISPSSGSAGSKVTINGSDLSLTGQSSTIKFGTMTANYGLGGPTSFQGVIIPVLSPGTYQVIMQVGQYTTNALTFTVTSTATTQASLSASPSSLSFTATAGGSNPAQQSIVLTNNSSVTASWSASDNATWLTLGQTPGTVGAYSNNFAIGGLLANINISGLAAGTYTTNITVSGNFPTLTIPVTLTVSGGNTFTASPSSLSFTATAGGSNPAQQSIALYNNSSATASWSASDNAAWLTLSNSVSGTINPYSNNYAFPLIANINISGLTAGTYTTNITVSGNFPTLTIPVTLTVSGSTASSLSLTSLQGYNQNTSAYSSTQATIGQYLILYGTFASSGNTVRIYNQFPNTAYVDYTPTAQSTSQLNVLLDTRLSGGYTATVVTRNSSGSQSNSKSIYIAGASSTSTTSAPTAILTANGSQSPMVNVGETISYVWSSNVSNANGTATSNYTSSPSSCGSGTWSATTPNGNTSATVVSTQAGCSYTITFTVTETATGKTASAGISVTVRSVAGVSTTVNSAPTAPTINGAQIVFVGSSQIYYGFSTDADGDAITYTIDWGDGSPQETQRWGSGYVYTGSHTWSVAGTYNITVTARDDRGAARASSYGVRVE